MDYKLSSHEVAKLIEEFQDLEKLFEGNVIVYHSEDISERLNLLYNELRRSANLKSQFGYLFSFLRLSGNFKKIPISVSDFVSQEYWNGSDFLYEEDFEEYLESLTDFEFVLRSEISIIESEIGKIYWKDNPAFDSFRNRKEKQPADEDAMEKQILELIMSSSQNEFHQASYTDMARAINALLKTSYSEKKLANRIAEKRTKKHRPEVFAAAIKKLESVIEKIKKNTPQV